MGPRPRCCHALGGPGNTRSRDVRVRATDHRRGQPPDGVADVPHGSRRRQTEAADAARSRGGRAALEVRDGTRRAGEVEALVELGDELVKRGPKWHDALGAVDGAERARALDLLGFERQVVYSSLCAFLFDLRTPNSATARTGRTTGRWPRSAPLIRASAASRCSISTTSTPASRCSTRRTRSASVSPGCPARAPGGRSPGHDAHDRVWAWLAERRMPFVLHVGSGPLPIGEAWTNDGRPPAAADDGRRDHQLQGLDGDPSSGDALHVRCWCSTACSNGTSAARRRDRDGRRLGAGHAAPPRPRGRHLEPVRASPRVVRTTTVGAGRGTVAVHAVPVRGRRPARAGGGSVPVPVLVGLPARGGWSRSASGGSRGRSTACPPR